MTPTYKSIFRSYLIWCWTLNEKNNEQRTQTSTWRVQKVGVGTFPVWRATLRTEDWNKQMIKMLTNIKHKNNINTSKKYIKTLIVCLRKQRLECN